jgi:DNA polymerase III subunit beta
MGIVVERQSLMNGLSLVQGIVERRNTVPILGHVLIEPEAQSIRLAATDLEVGISTQVPCKSGKEKSLTLNARKLFEIVRETEGEEFSINSLDNDWVELKCGRSRFKMMGLDPRSFPAMPSQSTKADGPKKSVKAALTVSAAVLATMIDKTIFSVSPDEARYNLSGVFLEAHDAGKARMVATDGHRLSMIDRTVPGFAMEGGTIIPRKGLTELRKLLDQDGDAEVKLLLDGQLASLKRGPTEVSMRLVEGEFPDYRGVVPKQTKYHIKVGRDALQASIKRAAIFSNERYHGVKLGLAAGALTVSSTSPEMGEASETIDVDYRGDEFAVGFNASYLLQALAVIPAESEIDLGLSDEASPGLLRTPSDTEFSYVVMPMRL